MSDPQHRKHAGNPHCLNAEADLQSHNETRDLVVQIFLQSLFDVKLPSDEVLVFDTLGSYKQYNWSQLIYILVEANSGWKSFNGLGSLTFLLKELNIIELSLNKILIFIFLAGKVFFIKFAMFDQ